MSTITAHAWLNDELIPLETRDAPLRHHTAGLQYTRTGYGSRIPTRTMVRLPGNSRWRRVYCCIWSNAGTCYINGPKQPDGTRPRVVITN